MDEQLLVLRGAGEGPPGRPPQARGSSVRGRRRWTDTGKGRRPRTASWRGQERSRAPGRRGGEAGREAGRRRPRARYAEGALHMRLSISMPLRRRMAAAGMSPHTSFAKATRDTQGRKWHVDGSGTFRAARSGTSPSATPQRSDGARGKRCWVRSNLPALGGDPATRSHRVEQFNAF